MSNGKILIKKHNQQTETRVNNAIKQYEEAQIPSRVLITAHNIYLSDPEGIASAYDPYDYYKEQQGIKYENISNHKGVGLFNDVSMSFLEEPIVLPIELISGIYYKNKKNNDYSAERLLLDLIAAQIEKVKKIIVLHPSPKMVEEIEEYNAIDKTYIIHDKELAELYAKQYEESIFIFAEDMNEEINADIMLINASNFEIRNPNHIKLLLNCIQKVQTNSIYGIAWLRFVDNKESALWESIEKKKLVFKQIILLPQEISNSSPKRKCFVYLKKMEAKEEKLKIQRFKYDEKIEAVIPDKEILISENKIKKSKNISKLLKECLEPKNSKTESVKEYTPAKLFFFSQEIPISYSLYNNKTTLKFFYGKTKNSNDPTKRGMKITPRRQKELKTDSEEERRNELERVPYKEKFYKEIVKDIKMNYLNDGKDVSLKTLWFCERDKLIKNNSYNDELAMKIFVDGSSKISTLNPKSSSGYDLFKALENEFDRLNKEATEHQIINLVNIIFRTVIKDGYLTNNIASSLFEDVSNRQSKRQREARNALTKKHLEPKEEKNILKAIANKCVKHSVYLAILIRMFTSIPPRELCGLVWNDFSLNEKTGVYSFSITKFVDKDGNIIPHSLKDEWDKYRVFPLPRLLGIMIKRRFDYLIDNGIKEKALKEYPIILSREDIKAMRKGIPIKNCKPSIVQEKSKKILKDVKISKHLIDLTEGENQKVVDINNYAGDTFKENFKDKAIDNAGFELDELCYCLGVEKPNTISKHYTDFTNEYVQLQMSRKLDRWCFEYYDIFNIKHQEPNERAGTKTIKGISGGVSSADINISQAKKNINLKIENKHGFRVIAYSYKED